MDSITFGDERFFSKELKDAMRECVEQCKRLSLKISLADGAAQQVLDAETISPEAIAEKSRARFVGIAATKELTKSLDGMLPLYAQAEKECEAEGNRIRTEVIPAEQGAITRQLLGLGFLESQTERLLHIHPKLIELHETADATWRVGTSEKQAMCDRVNVRKKKLLTALTEKINRAIA